MRAIEEQVILVTGATDGIRRQTAIDLALRGANVPLHGRDDERGADVMEEIIETTGNRKIGFYKADFSSLTEVRRLAERIQADWSGLDVLYTIKIRHSERRGKQAVLPLAYGLHSRYFVETRHLQNLTDTRAFKWPIFAPFPLNCSK